MLPQPVPAVADLTALSLVELLRHPSAAMRLHVQRELLRRVAGADSNTRASVTAALRAVADDSSASQHARVVALWTLRQANAAAFGLAAASWLGDEELAEHAIRAVADLAGNADVQPALVAAVREQLSSPSPRVQAAAVIAAGRLGDREAASRLLQVASQPLEDAGADAAEPIDDWRLPHPQRVLPHLAMQAVVALDAVDACIEALPGSSSRGALWALKHLHSAEAVDGLFRTLASTRDDTLRQEIWTTLIRLSRCEGDYTADSPGWWGTRPDTTGPYYDREEWSESERIAEAVAVALGEAAEPLATHLKDQLARHVVEIGGGAAAPVAAMDELAEPIAAGA